MVAGAHGGVWVADTDSLVFRMYDGSGLVREVSLGHEPVHEAFRPELRIEVPIGMEVLDIDHGRVLTRSPDRPQVVQVHQLGEGS